MRCDPKTVAQILWGPSQVGKSSFVNLLLDQRGDQHMARALVGTGNGQSVTTDACLYQVSRFNLADMGGYGDTLLRFTPDEMAARASVKLAGESISAVQVLLFESVCNDTMNVLISLAKLVEGFGEKVVNSVLVVATKTDAVSERRLNQRLEVIKEALQKAGIPQDRLVLWRNEDFEDDDTVERQIQELEDALSYVSPVRFDHLQNLNTRITERAQELCDNQETLYKDVETNLLESYVGQEACTIQVPVIEQQEYTESVPRVVEGGIGHIVDDISEAHGRGFAITASVLTLGLINLYGVRRNPDKIVHYDVVKTKDVISLREEVRLRNVTKYHQVTRSKKVELEPFPVEHFSLEARRQIILEAASAITG
ncbi:expressed unknown protein [Seminavis robusta]|uniref:Uncharacterized protein n=1 Tax=Seminavis robusta TaxID=568900 RepID=A0A9N8ELV5_9STRA|nr:expressed unknown protein [Seminavis robusta]|eukprot:Sro1193_g251230.1 n/a (369) ;mRNA; f:25297-26480